MFLFPAVLILGDSWIHVYSLYSRDIVSDIKISVDETLGFYAALIIPYIYSDDSYIWFQKSFNGLWFEYKFFNIYRMPMILR